MAWILASIISQKGHDRLGQIWSHTCRENEKQTDIWLDWKIGSHFASCWLLKDYLAIEWNYWLHSNRFRVKCFNKIKGINYEFRYHFWFIFAYNKLKLHKQWSKTRVMSPLSRQCLPPSFLLPYPQFGAFLFPAVLSVDYAQEMRSFDFNLFIRIPFDAMLTIKIQISKNQFFHVSFFHLCMVWYFPMTSDSHEKMSRKIVMKSNKSRKETCIKMKSLKLRNRCNLRIELNRFGLIQV